MKMPKKREIKSLKEMCLDNVVYNINRFCFMYNTSEQNACFEAVQKEFSKKLWDMLLEAKTLEDQCLNFLINPHLKEITLFENSKISIELIMDRLRIVGKTITSIDLSFCTVSDAVLKAMTHSLSNIETINFYSTECTDEVLLYIACNCPLLKALDIADCSKITDKGLINLCKTGKGGKVVKNLKLLTLDVEGTEVTNKGVGFVLKNIPSLTSLKYENLPQVLCEMYESDFLNSSLGKTCKYNLTDVRFFLYPIEELPVAMKICTFLCPNITSLEVDLFFIEPLLYAEFSHLQEVTLTCHKPAVSFDAMNRFLEFSGSELLKFDLSDAFICSRTLANFCPKLKTLSLTDVQFNTIKVNKKIPLHAFSHLTEFKICEANFEDRNTFSSVNFILSSSKNIEELTFDNVKALSGEFIDLVLKNNPLISLTTLYLSNSDVNVEIVERFLLADNKLETLILLQCKNISNTDYENLQSLVNTKKFDVKIMWECFHSDKDDSYDCDSGDFDTYESDVSY